MTKEAAAQLLADRLRSHVTRLKSDLTFQAAKKKSAQERKQGAEMYAIKKPARAMTAMFAGLLGTMRSANVDDYINQPKDTNYVVNYFNTTNYAMPNVNPAELSILDYLNILFIAFTTIMMMLYGWVILRREYRHQADQAEPEEETAPAVERSREMPGPRRMRRPSWP